MKTIPGIIEYIKSKEFWVINVIIIIVGILSLIIFLYVILPIFTNAGEEITVPNWEGKNLKEIKKEEALVFKLEVDSPNYDPSIPPLQIISQKPSAGTKVKPGRTIYITVNKKQPTLVPIPNYKDYVSGQDYISYLQSRGFFIEKIDSVYNYDKNAANDQVVGVLYKGKLIKSGELLPKGSRVVMVVNINPTNDTSIKDSSTQDSPK